MALLKRKQERTTTLSIRIPVSINEIVHTLRKTADEAGFDLTASLTDAVVKWTKQVSEELQPPSVTVHKSKHSNGSDPEPA